MALNQGLLHLWSKFGDPSLNGWWIIARTSSWLTDTHTHTYTHTGNDNTRRPKLASGKKKHQSSVSLAFVRRIHRGPVNSPHKIPVTRKMFPFDDVIMLMIIGGLYPSITVSGPDTCRIKPRSIICDKGSHRYSYDLASHSCMKASGKICPSGVNSFATEKGCQERCEGGKERLLYPALQRSWKGGILVSRRPSVRPSARPSVDRIVSALYLQQYSSNPFHTHTSYQAT